MADEESIAMFIDAHQEGLRQLPDDVVELLQRVRKSDPEDLDYGMSAIAEGLLREHGVKLTTVEEDLRAELAEVRRNAAGAARAQIRAEQEYQRVAEVNQRYGKQINDLRAELAKAKSIKKQLELSSGDAALLRQVRALLKAAGITVKVQMAPEKEK